MFVHIDVNPGFSITWDNVQKATECRHQSTERKNEMHMWALAFATINRFPSEYITPSQTGSRRAADIALEEILPGRSEWANLRQVMEVVVARMLVGGGLPAVAAISQDTVLQHITHDHSHESSQKSTLVNMTT